MFLYLQSVQVGNVLDVLVNHSVSKLAKTIKFLNKGLCLAHQPWKDVAKHDLVLELVVKVTNVLQEGKGVLLDVLQELL